MLPLRSRILPILGVLVGAPVCAEYLQAYLPTTGRLGEQLAGLLVLGPLYGGAALLVREVAVRTGRGWPGVLLLATAFGVLMPGLVDLSLWRETDPDVPYWAAMRHDTLVEPFGFAVYPLISWVTGHVLYSIGAPLALLAALAPRHRGRPLLGRVGLPVTAALIVTPAWLIHVSMRETVDAPSAGQALAVVAAALVAVGVALSRYGRPVPHRVMQTRWTPARAAAAGLVVALTLDLLPWSRGGTALLVAVLLLASIGSVRAARARTWGPAHVTAIAAAGLVARCIVGVLAPLPPGVTTSARFGQSAVLIALVVAIGTLAWRRAAAPPPAPAPAPVAAR